MATQTGTDFTLYVETTPGSGTYTQVMNLNAYAKKSNRDETRYPLLGTSISLLLPGVKTEGYTFGGFLDTTDPGQALLRAAEANNTAIKVKALFDTQGDGVVQTVRVASFAHEARPDTLQTIVYDLTATDAATDLSNVPLSRYMTSEGYTGGTFTRASTATYFDGAGVIQTASSGVIRDSHWLNGVRTTLLEEQRTNEKANSDDLSGWGGANTTSTTGQASPMSGHTAVRLIPTVTNAAHYRDQASGAIGAGQPQALSCFFKAASGSYRGALQLEQGADGFGVNVNLSTGVVSADAALTYGAGAVLSSRAFQLGSSGWWRLEVVGTLGSQTSCNMRVRVHNASGTDTYAGDGSSGIDAFGAQHEKNTRCCSSFISTAGSAVTRSADVLSLPLPWTPRAFTIYTKGYDVGTGRILDARLIAVGDSNQVVQNSASGTGQFNIQRNFPGWLGTSPAATSALGDLIEVRGVLVADGSLKAGISINGAAESTSADATTVTLPGTWGASPHIAVGYDGGGVFAFVKLLIMTDERTLAQMRSYA